MCQDLKKQINSQNPADLPKEPKLTVTVTGQDRQEQPEPINIVEYGDHYRQVMQVHW